jgi:hypothetical protein
MLGLSLDKSSRDGVLLIASGQRKSGQRKKQVRERKKGREGKGREGREIKRKESDAI